MRRKLYKLIKKPRIFLRDYLNKKCPVINSELRCSEQEEFAILQHTLIQEQDLLNKEEQFSIDVVYTWVNRNSIWKQEFEIAQQNFHDTAGLHALDEARFADHDELFYSLKSVRKFMPWVRRIFIVTNSVYNLPSYLKEDCNVTIVTHAEIINKKYLPTFNSHVIEAHLHKIPKLSEDFIYFNDDVFVARELPREHFFQSNGLASLYLSSKKIDGMHARGILTPSLLASIYSKNLLSREFGTYINQVLIHTYVPLKKSMYEIAWNLYEKEIEGFLVNCFRKDKDINMATFLVPWLMYIYRCSSVKTDICYYFNIRSPHAPRQYERLLNKSKEERPHSICANDFCSFKDQKNNTSYQEYLKKFLKTYFTESI